MSKDLTREAPLVGLFVTCLVDLFRPAVGFAAIKLLEDGGARVEVPLTQTCCGQPAFNSGDRADAQAIARQVVDAFESFDYVVAPSGSCAGMLKLHYPALLADDPVYAERAKALAEKSYELTTFLVDVLHVDGVDANYAARVTYHDSCASLRETGSAGPARKLLASIRGIDLVGLPDGEACCGFGGTFAIKFAGISSAIAEAKSRNIAATGASCVVSCDLGCLMQIAGKLSREGRKIQVRHVAELLANMIEASPIGGERI
ncbi:MAG TPA: (Fe-S)-binding protein [Methyloceanibacter sp.]|jgi:L-lactate dehydrogenase complex protein LldE|nr:(Fe-S)-binding protein [Methyloceanibacter sp.]